MSESTSTNNKTIISAIYEKRNYLYEIIGGILILTISVLLLIYPNIIESPVKITSYYTAINIVWIILILLFLIGVYPYLIRPRLNPLKNCPECPANNNTNSPNIAPINTLSNLFPTLVTLPNFIPALALDKPTFSFDQYARPNDQDTRQLDITILVSKPRPVSKSVNWENHYAISEIAIYDYLGKKVKLSDKNVTVTSASSIYPLNNLYDNDLTTYFYTNTDDPDQDNVLQEIKIKIGEDRGISRIILVNKDQPEILTGMQVKVLGTNPKISSDPILLLDYSILEDNPIRNIEIDPISGILKDTSSSVITLN